jgi:DNA-binding IclR family transcriptional regulator
MDADLLDDADVATVLAAIDLLFDMALMARRDLDAIDNLIRLGVSQANVRQIVAHPESQLLYAYAETSPPDGARLPISIAALSRVLNLPFETVRRRTVRLCEAGLLTATSDGLVVPGTMLDTPGHFDALKTVHHAMTRTFERLQQAGFFMPGDLSAPDQTPAEPPLRAIGRLAGEFYLRMLAPLHAWTGDPIDAVLLLCLLRRRQGEARAEAGASIRLGSPAQIARELGYSSETVRRRLQRMADTGLCRRDAEGFVAPLDAIRVHLQRRLAEPSELNLRRLYRRLSELGAVTPGAGFGLASPTTRPLAS